MYSRAFYVLAGLCLLLTSCCGHQDAKKAARRITLYNESKAESLTIRIREANVFDAQEIQELLQTFIRSGDLVFDVGANIGKQTELYLACGARVIGFEPQPACVKVLEEKFKDNARVIIEQMGLGEGEGTNELFICTASPTISTLSEDYVTSSRFSDHGYDWDKKETIQLTTLDKMIQKYGLPRFCKIDVENFELQVLKGLSQPIPYLSFECNADQLETTKKCLAHLTSLGYREFNLALGERGLFISSNWISADELLEKIATLITTRDFSSIWGLWGDIYARHPRRDLSL